MISRNLNEILLLIYIAQLTIHRRYIYMSCPINVFNMFNSIFISEFISLLQTSSSEMYLSNNFQL